MRITHPGWRFRRTILYDMAQMHVLCVGMATLTIEKVFYCYRLLLWSWAKGGLSLQSHVAFDRWRMNLVVRYLLSDGYRSRIVLF